MQRLLKPNARVDIIHELKESGIEPTSMIDISDGLASELFHLCKASNLGCAIFEDKLPIHTRTETALIELNLDTTTAALNGGEDYELLFTIKQADFEKLKNHPEIATIGYMATLDTGKKLVTRGENVIELKAQGWVHM